MSLKKKTNDEIEKDAESSSSFSSRYFGGRDGINSTKRHEGLDNFKGREVIPWYILTANEINSNVGNKDLIKKTLKTRFETRFNRIKELNEKNFPTLLHFIDLFSHDDYSLCHSIKTDFVNKYMSSVFFHILNGGRPYQSNEKKFEKFSKPPNKKKPEENKDRHYIRFVENYYLAMFGRTFNITVLIRPFQFYYGSGFQPHIHYIDIDQRHLKKNLNDKSVHNGDTLKYYDEVYKNIIELLTPSYGYFNVSNNRYDVLGNKKLTSNRYGLCVQNRTVYFNELMITTIISTILSEDNKYFRHIYDSYICRAKDEVERNLLSKDESLNLLSHDNDTTSYIIYEDAGVPLFDYICYDKKFNSLVLSKDNMVKISNFFREVIRQVLIVMSQLKSDAYSFSHSQFTVRNVFVKFTDENDINTVNIKIGVSQTSSITHNGFRFYAKSRKNNDFDVPEELKNILNIFDLSNLRDGEYGFSKDSVLTKINAKSFLKIFTNPYGMFMSYDIYSFALSMLSLPIVWEFLNMKKNEPNGSRLPFFVKGNELISEKNNSIFLFFSSLFGLQLPNLLNYIEDNYERIEFVNFVYDESTKQGKDSVIALYEKNKEEIKKEQGTVSDEACNLIDLIKKEEDFEKLKFTLSLQFNSITENINDLLLVDNLNRPTYNSLINDLIFKIKEIKKNVVDGEELRIIGDKLDKLLQKITIDDKIIMQEKYDKLVKSLELMRIELNVIKQQSYDGGINRRYIEEEVKSDYKEFIKSTTDESEEPRRTEDVTDEELGPDDEETQLDETKTYLEFDKEDDEICFYFKIEPESKKIRALPAPLPAPLSPSLPTPLPSSGAGTGIHIQSQSGAGIGTPPSSPSSSPLLTTAAGKPFVVPQNSPPPLSSLLLYGQSQQSHSQKTDEYNRMKTFVQKSIPLIVSVESSVNQYLNSNVNVRFFIYFLIKYESIRRIEQTYPPKEDICRLIKMNFEDVHGQADDPEKLNMFLNNVRIRCNDSNDDATKTYNIISQELNAYSANKDDYNYKQSGGVTYQQLLSSTTQKSIQGLEQQSTRASTPQSIATHQFTNIQKGHMSISSFLPKNSNPPQKVKDSKTCVELSTPLGVYDVLYDNVGLKLKININATYNLFGVTPPHSYVDQKIYKKFFIELADSNFTHDGKHYPLSVCVGDRLSCKVPLRYSSTDEGEAGIFDKYKWNYENKKLITKFASSKSSVDDEDSPVTQVFSKAANSILYLAGY